MTELTTMCAVIRNGRVLMINRGKSWRGWAFPGGHIEDGESVTECVIREVYEEAGIVLQNPLFRGIADIYNTDTRRRYLVFNFTAEKYEGEVSNQCDEGEIAWVDIQKIQALPLAEGMEYRLPLFLEASKRELYIEWNERDGYTRVDYS